MKAKTALVFGAGGFIGSHMVKHLASEGYRVVGADLKYPEFSASAADIFHVMDLTVKKDVDAICNQAAPYRFDEIYQFAALMGGASYIFSGLNDADIAHQSAMINLNVAKAASRAVQKPKLFFASSACVYPQEIQLHPNNLGLKEKDDYPSNPDSVYGKEKLWSESVYDSYFRNAGLDIRIGRFHNIFGPEGTYIGGKEKAPAAICRKIAEAKTGDTIEIWGDGQQTRSFLYIDEAIDFVRRLMQSSFHEPLNIGSSEMVSINYLVEMVCDISGKQHLFVKHTEGPQGVRGRNSDNTLCKEILGVAPSAPLRQGIEKLYEWVNAQVNKKQLA